MITEDIITFRKLVLAHDIQNSYNINRKVTGMSDAKQAFNAAFHMNLLPEEIFTAMFLDTKLCINGMAIIAKGSLNSSCISMRDLFKYALAYNAHGIVVAHNHPSGNPKPSAEDEDVTKIIQLAADLMNICFMDHIIIADNQHFSFYENNLMDKQLKLESV